MKTLYPAGSILLVTNALALFCAAAIWVDWLRRGEYLLWHLILMACVMLLPALLWRHKIEINAHFLQLRSAGRHQKIRLADINRVQIEFQGQRCLLSIYLPNSNRPALECDITNFRRAEIKNLLQYLKTRNTSIQLVTPKKF